ncbi:MAG: TadE/TadG family type IV pilus assembly protein [Candidatus Dormibacteria bacterium]
MRRQRGQAMVLMALMATVLLGAVGLAIDGGLAFARERSAQNAADGASLAAAYDIAQGLSEAAATVDAQSVTVLSAEKAASLTLVFRDAGGASTGSASQVVTVDATVSEASPTNFMGVLGIHSTTVTNTATAKVAGSRCGLCVLSPGASPALRLTGSGQVTVTGNSVMVNSSANPAASATGSGSVTADSIGVVGTTSTTGSATFSPTPSTIGHFADPLAGVPVPQLGGANQGNVSASGVRDIGPGIWNNITVNGGGVLTLEPGVYVMTGGMKVTGSGVLEGAGVMLYFACSAYPTSCTPGQKGAALSLTGSGDFSVTPPISGTYKGLSVFYDRNSTATMSITGSGSDLLTGSVYGASADLVLTGSAGVQQLDSVVVVSTATLTGSGEIQLVFNAAQNYAGSALSSLLQ